jgi:lambda family phage tail tape measure protein
MSAEAFQRQAFAAKTVGIEQDKYADIIKDVNDKVGDFLTTGAGPMADFFDTIGKKVGVTAEDFKGLSGDQALGLYVDTLQKAGANQQEVAFHMEALASDTTALVPLLANGAAEMDRLGEAAGTMLSDEQIRNAQLLNEEFDTMTSNIKNQLMGAFIDVATEAAKFFNLIGTEQQKAAEAMKRELNSQIEDLQESLQELADNEVDGVAASFADLNDIQFKNRLGDDISEENAERLRGILERQLELKKQQYFSAVDAAAAADEEANAQERTTKAIQQRGFGAGSGVGLAGSGNNPEDDFLQEITVTATKRGGATGLERQQEIQREFEEWLAQRNADKARELEDLGVKYGIITDHQIVYRDEIAELDKLLAANVINQDEYNKKVAELSEQENPWEGLFEELNNFDNLLKESALDGVNQMADAIAEMVVSGKADFKSLAASILQDIAKMIIKMLILKAIQSSMGMMGFANGGIAPAGRASIVGERGPEIIQPAAASRVIPNHAMGGGGGNAVNVGQISVTLQEREDESSEEQSARIGKAIREEMRGLVINEMGNQMRRGNMMNPAPIKAFR